VYLDRRSLWSRLTRYRKWRGPNNEQLYGTIGKWIKERYRSMRGYKVPANAVPVSHLLAWYGNFLNSDGANLATLLR
jgi:hypothetical protein